MNNFLLPFYCNFTNLLFKYSYLNNIIKFILITQFNGSVSKKKSCHLNFSPSFKLSTNLTSSTILSSLLGVGAPEVLVIGLVALVVFGPKGLADATKSFSQIFRTFQPTLQEIISISNDLNASFKNEIGLQEPLRIETKSNVESRFVSSKGENKELNTKIVENSQKDIIFESGLTFVLLNEYTIVFASERYYEIKHKDMRKYKNLNYFN